MTISIRAPGGAITQTSVTLAAATDTRIVAADTGRTYLALQNQGTGDVNMTFDGTAATADTGWGLNAASAAGRQGGSVSWEGDRAAQNEIRGYSAAGTTIVVLAG